MALLKILSGDAAGTTYTIGSRNQRIGRAQLNDLCLADISVSGSHCEIALEPGGQLRVRDLGSTNGTFIEGQRISEALAEPGQRLRLGSLELLFEDAPLGANPSPAIPPPALNLPPPPVVTPFNAGARVSNPGAPPVATPPTARPVAAHGGHECANHPGVPSVAVCKKCGAKPCVQCARQQKVGRNIVHFCNACGGQCDSVADAQKAAAINAGRTRTFGEAVRRAFAYPFRGNGVILLGCGTVFFGAVELLPGFGILRLALTVLTWGYLFAFMQRIVVTSAAGEDLPPEFPEVTEIYSDIVVPFFQFFVTLLVAIGPGLFLLFQFGPAPGIAALALGMVFYPMALLGVAMSDSYTALNPIFVFSSILKVPGQYLMACFLFGALLALRLFLQALLYESLPLFAGQFAFWFIFLVLLMVQMRILGMLYFLNRPKLGWRL